MTASNRRKFLKTSSLGAAAMIVPRHVLGGPGFVAPSDRVNVAVVGVGGRGFQNVKELLQLADVRVVAVADPAERWDLSQFYYRGAAGRVPVCEAIEQHYRQSDSKYRCQQHVDYRQMLRDGNDDFDAVLCATPDHLHGHVSLMAMRAGKHVYCEKPLTHNIAEARLVAQVAKETGLATQMGNQGHSTDDIRLTCEIVRAGLIGDIHEVHAWVPATRWNRTVDKVPTQPQPVPAGLDWDLWCGPRTPVGFHEVYAPVTWRDFWQFGCGAMGDFGCHDLDSAVWGLELGLPERIEMHPAGGNDPAMIPFGEIGYFDFNAAGHGDGPGGRNPLRITWYSGGLMPPRPDALPEKQQLPGRGVMFVGDKGLLVCGGAGGRPDIYPLALRESVTIPEPSIVRSKGHHRDWIDAIKGGPAASSEFGYAAKLTEITLLGVLALRAKEIIHWDAERMHARGAARANELVAGEYRPGWELIP
jgi:predicted dehydrogenase